jgi:hypothetical protein
VVSASEQALEEVLFLHRPTRWFFGHYHMSRETVREDCQFTCLPEGAFLDVDLPVDPSDFRR